MHCTALPERPWAAQIGAAESRQAVEEEFFHGATLVDATGLDVAARAGTLMRVFVGHQLEHSRRGAWGPGALKQMPSRASRTKRFWGWG